jgi:peptidyl-prolyl cis-trans isomerase C
MTSQTPDATPPQRFPLHHLLVHNGQLATELHRELIEGADFATLAKEYSVCFSRHQSGYAGEHLIDDLPKPIRDRLLDSSDVYPLPVKTHLGFHLLQINEKHRQFLPQRYSASSNETNQREDHQEAVSQTSA